MDKKKKRLIFTVVKIAVTVLASIIIVGLTAPIYFVIIRSFSPAEDMFPIKLFPSEPVLRHFAELFGGTGELGLPFSRNFFSSLVVSVITAAVQIPIVCAMAYVLAKVKAPGVNAFDRIIEWSLILTPLVLYVPQYFLMLKIGVSDSIFAMILPFIASPISVYLVKRYMSVIPDEIVYCARLDGASHFRICFGIVMPSIKPAIMTVMVLSLGNMWSYSGELFAQSAAIKPIGALMPRFASGEGNAGMLCAVAAVIAVPMIVLAVVFRSEIAETAAYAGIKPEPYTKDGACIAKLRLKTKKADKQ